ncbi:MAG: CPBP family intramembrane metalloprotease [Patescibacteria group bacterium]|nr:CPBP family intramembrane metalloprotease [Patescibacteria group bacterium]
MAERIDRRTFLRLSAACGVALAVGEATRWVLPNVDNGVEQVTGIRAGNANYYAYQEQIQQNCMHSLDKPSCIQHELSQIKKPPLVIQLLSALTEEIYFRAMPSMVVSALEDTENIIKDTSLGVDGNWMTRKACIAGGISSLLFGLAHNFTFKGFDTKTIPASQTLGGMILWVLQRKYGVFSSTLAHFWYNLRV